MKSPIRKTRSAWNHPRHAHFVTYSCFKRLPLLLRERSRKWVVEAMEETRRSLRVALWAYVVMPEHVHVLLYPTESNYQMRQVLASLKRSVSLRARDYLEKSDERRWLERLMVVYPDRRVFRFWQAGGGFDRNIFKDSSVPAIIDYIHNNPVRRGLVLTPTDWKWSSARFWAGSRDVPLGMDVPVA